eukprot:symbB.v1.2.022617.t1/scaffold1976.1/size93997/4
MPPATAKLLASQDARLGLTSGPLWFLEPPRSLWFLPCPVLRASRLCQCCHLSCSCRASTLTPQQGFSSVRELTAMPPRRCNQKSLQVASCKICASKDFAVV